MPLEVSRLRRSKEWLVARKIPEFGFYAINLWLAAWHDVPAASLEDDDDVLADAAMCNPTRWLEIRNEVLRKWIKCSDGRLYHPVVAEKAVEAWEAKMAQRERTRKAREAKEAKTKNSDNTVAETVTNSVTDNVTASKGSKGKGSKGNNISNVPASPEGFDAFWEVYPRREGKGQARKAYASALGKIDALRLLEATQRFAKACEGKEQKFIPHPSTWLNGERWLDEPAAQPAVQAQSTMFDDLDAEERRWMSRLSSFDEGVEWAEDLWGPPPGKPGHRCPKRLTDRYQATKGQAAA